ncbi:MAG TPA: glycosyltransferase [Gammaproteobacteria bacterium]|nr:glycosyltransferase [Gammaproteobacteria bacterium]
MSRQQDIETRLKDVLECAAQIHRRESGAYAQASKALADLERVTADRRSPDSDPAHDHARIVTSFHGRDKTAIALTLDPQFVRLPRCESARELWATPLTASLRARPAVELRLARETPSASDAPEPVADAGDPGPRTLRLMPFRPHRLVSLEPGSQPLIARLARTEGTFCVLRLELIEPGSARAGELAAAAAEPHAGETPGATPPQRDPTAADDTGVRSAAELDRQLWGGYAADALPQLERLKFDPRVAPKERAGAAWCLSRWHFVAENYAAALAEIAYAKSLPVPVAPRLVLAEARCLINVGRCREALELLRNSPPRAREADCLLLESTALRQRILLDGGDLERAESAQLECINRMLGAADLAPIRKRRAGEPLSLANIEAIAEPVCVTQSRKVSVVMPAFNAEASIGWALGSVLSQTWDNLEVIVVDDASEDATADRVAEIASADSRVRLVRLETNGGSYVARNAGARLATGVLVMIHDADDWSHPQYIERQIEALDAYPSAVGVKSHWIRVDEGLQTLGTWMPRDSIFELNFSSLMFRREILDVLGGWDEVRVAGDAEFYARFRAVYGEQSIVTVPRNCPLAFSLTRHDSLTRSSATHLRSMYHGVRRNYMDAYRWWHERLDRQTDLPLTPARSRRPFPNPAGNAPRALDEQRYDLIVVADYAHSCAAFDNAISACVAASREGRRVAALHWPHFQANGRAAPQSEFYAVCVDRGIDLISAGDSVQTDLLLIASPSALQHVLDPCPQIEARNVVVLVDGGPQAAGVAEPVQCSPLDVRHNVEDLFGQETRWLPTSEAAARMMRADRRYPRPAAGLWRPIVDGARLAKRPLRWRGSTGRRPVIGRRIVGELDWPARRAELDLAYGAAAAWDVRFHSDNAALIALLEDAPEHWEIVPRQRVGSVEFCRDLDFYVHYPHELCADELSQGLLEAMALGVPVIVPPRYHALLGNAASYSSAEMVAATVERLWTSEREYLERAAAGRSFVLERFGPDDVIGRLRAACAAVPNVVRFARDGAARSVS